MQVPICTGGLTSNNPVLTFNHLDWLHYQSVNHNILWPLQPVKCRPHRIPIHPLYYRGKGNPLEVQHLLPCPTSSMVILVTQHLERFHTLVPRKPQELNCLLLCRYPWDNRHCCNLPRLSPTSLGPDL